MAFLSKSQIPRQTLNRRQLRRGTLQKIKQEQHVLNSVYSVKTTTLSITNNPLIFWVGNDYAGLFDQGALYGFKCQWFQGLDLSVLQHAKCITVSQIDILDKVHSFINFACEYGIQSIWLNKTLPPEMAYWNFNLRFHIDDSNLFWARLCQLIK